MESFKTISAGFFLKATLWPDFTELFTFLVRILLEIVKLDIFKTNLATLQALYFVTLVYTPRFDLS